ncbi:aminotransferase class V-fold PLP-dependent enzyme [Balneola vulgaris]|uniref:aminotransferase class V-fold PLP-dependent enzyme n=1 Tax=Balneola vulgaris TaxID=287535 RepID=UPI00035D1D45|nr:aminotransferase class V-fold PLP-dependent enzyme [Balneola vulgaris]
MKTSRRGFIKTLASGVGAAAFGSITAVSEWANHELQSRTMTGLESATDYSLSPSVTYLNHGSIGTIPILIQQAHRHYLELCETNPWLHMWGPEWVEPVELSRQKAADFINTKAENIAFTHNTTEVFNLIAQGFPLGPNDEVLFCNLNHAGASIPFQVHSKTRGYKVRSFDFPTDQLPTISIQQILDLYDREISSNTKVLSIPHIDNTFGLRHPLKEIAKLARSKGVELIAVDAAQTVGMIPINVSDLDVDVLATSTHKWIQSPKGVSFAYFSEKAQREIAPMWVTWGQNRWENSARIFEDYGTRNLAEVVTLAHCFDFQKNSFKSGKTEKLQSLTRYAKTLAHQNPNTEWRSPNNWELSGSLFVIELKHKKPSTFSNEIFNQHGVVLRPFDNHSTIRVSPNSMNTKSEIDTLFKLI